MFLFDLFTKSFMDIKALISEEEINERIKELAKEFHSEKELNFVAILDGAKKFSEKLISEIKKISGAKINAYEIKVSSYKGQTQSSGRIELKKDVLEDLRGKNIILVDDILDSGLTMNWLIDHFEKKGVNSIKVCVLLNKRKNRIFNISADYEGFVIDDHFVIGYGLDLNAQYRDLDYIGYLPDA